MNCKDVSAQNGQDYFRSTAGHQTCCAYVRRQESRTARKMAESEQGNNRRGAIAGLIIAVVLLAVGIWLARELTAASKLQDCVMSGRTNCNVIEPAQ